MTPALPIAAYENEILEKLKQNPIIDAATGAGKSTKVIQMLLRAGYKVICTQPRRLAARNLAIRVAEEMGEKLGETIGFQTRDERVVGKQTRGIFVTDGLAMVRELMGGHKGWVLVLDEVHEWNLNIEVLIAWAKRQIELGADFKVVIMSATLETERLSRFLGGVPVISVPGRLHPVTELPPGMDIISDTAKLVRQGRNVLVFQPGKTEITETIEALEARGLNAEILPLHGQLTREEQQRCFQHYGRPKVIVSTNVAETSVTIDDIDAVIDSGMERREELVGGVKGLYLLPISLANRKQRMGRAGRTHEGFYIDHCPVPYDERPEFPVAEILRTHLDQAVLQLAGIGIDMEELPFFNQPDMHKIQAAKQTLHLLGCLDLSGNVTDIGRMVVKLPVSVQYARMIVEANRLGVVDDIITIAAILDQGGITARGGSWQRLALGERTSDVLAQLAVYTKADGMNRKEMIDSGIFAKSFYEARRLRKHIADGLKGKVEFGSSGKQENILRAVCAGMVEHVYVSDEYGNFIGGDDMPRQLARESVVYDGRLLVGQPWDLQIKTRNGPAILHLVRMVTKIDLLMLADVAGHLFDIREGLYPRYDHDKAEVMSTEEVYFNGRMLRSREVPTPDHPEAERLKAPHAELQQQLANARLLRDLANDLLIRHTDDLTDELYDQLSYLDVEDYQFRGTIFQIEQWIVHAQSVTRRAQQYVDSLQGDVVDLSILQDRFARR